MTENWRKKIAISLVFTLVEPKVGSANSLPFSRMLDEVICSRRNCMANTCLLAADRSPVTFSPAEFLPENVNTGMAPSLQFRTANLLNKTLNVFQWLPSQRSLPYPGRRCWRHG